MDSGEPLGRRNLLKLMGSAAMTALLPGDAASLQELVLLPSTPEMDARKMRELQDGLDSIYHATARKTLAAMEPQREALLERLFHELTRAIPSSIPSARKMAKQCRFYKFSEGLNEMASKAELSADGKNAALVMAISSASMHSAANVIKVEMGHELGHQLFVFNPDLAAAPEFTMPLTSAPDQEMQRLGLSEEEKRHYKNELRADNVALRLTRDWAAFHEEFYRSEESRKFFAMLRVGNAMPEGLHPGESGGGKIIHPSNEVRLAEGEALAHKLGLSTHIVQPAER